MLPESAFLRRLPAFLDRAQVVQLESLIFSADAVENCLNAIRQSAGFFREKICEAPREVRQRMFIDAWTIVDCLHVVRQVLKALDYLTPQAIAFIDKYEVAKSLRDKMDHLAGNAWNISRSKNQSPPFGAICYLCVSDEDIVQNKDATEISSIGSVMLTAGRFEGPQTAQLINPSGQAINYPVCLFRLEAFNIILELEKAQLDLSCLMTEINEKIETQLNERAEAISIERGIQKEKLMAFGGSGFCFYIKGKVASSAKNNS